MKTNQQASSKMSYRIYYKKPGQRKLRAYPELLENVTKDEADAQATAIGLREGWFTYSLRRVIGAY
jgi:hypothetical protein